MRVLLRVPASVDLHLPSYRDYRWIDNSHPTRVSEYLWGCRWAVITPETLVAPLIGDVSAIVSFSDAPDPFWDQLARVSCQRQDLMKVGEYLARNAHELSDPRRFTLRVNEEMEEEISRYVKSQMS